MSLHMHNVVSSSKVVGCHWFYIALVLMLSCSSTLQESAAKCETCRDLVKHFMEVVDDSLDFLKNC